MYCYPVCHGNYTGAFQLAIKMEKVSVLMFKNYLQENFWVHNLVKNFFKFTWQEMSSVEIWVSLAKSLQRGLSKQWLNSGHSQLCCFFTSSDWRVGKTPGPDQSRVGLLYSSLCSGNLFSHSHGLRHHHLLAFLGIWSAKVDDDSSANTGTSSA